ncbi:MAG: hypothetical protein PHX25_00470 [Candidatus Pacebacteria bacterium]|nr:hypothetical protein [Candidatus Paceibacterota bacterium]
MAQGLVVIYQIGQILNPLFDITPRMMSCEEEKLGFIEEDFPGVGRGDMFVVSHPDHFASRAIEDFSSENIQCDLFPDGFGDDDDAEDFLCNDDHLFPDETAMHDPAYAEAWAQFVAEKGAGFYTDHWTDNDTLTFKSPTSQRVCQPVTPRKTELKKENRECHIYRENPSLKGHWKCDGNMASLKHHGIDSHGKYGRKRPTRASAGKKGDQARATHRRVCGL